MGHKPFVQDKAPSHRPARMAQQIKEDLSEMIPGQIRDPRVRDLGFLTITEVQVTHDMRNATVKFALMGDTQSYKDVEEGLNSAATYLRKELMRRLNTRITPHLTFKYDKGFGASQEIETLLKKVSEADKTRGSGTDDSESEEE